MLKAKFVFLMVTLVTLNAAAGEKHYNSKLSAHDVDLLEKIRLKGPLRFGVYSAEFQKRFKLPNTDLITFDNPSVLAVSAQIKYEFVGLRGGNPIPAEGNNCSLEVYVDNKTSGIKPPFDTYHFNDRRTQTNYPFSVYDDVFVSDADFQHLDKQTELGSVKIFIDKTGKPINKIRYDEVSGEDLDPYVKNIYPGIDMWGFDVMSCENILPDKNRRILFIKDWNKPYEKWGEELNFPEDNTFTVHLPEQLSEKLKPYIDADKARFYSDFVPLKLPKKMK